MKEHSLLCVMIRDCVIDAVTQKTYEKSKYSVLLAAKSALFSGFKGHKVLCYVAIYPWGRHHDY